MANGSGYIHGFGPVEEQRLRDQASTLASVVFHDYPLPAPGGRLLELGCGVGAELDLLAERAPAWQRVGVDISASQVAAAHAHTDAAVVRADATCLPFGTGVFDAVVTIWLLEHVPDPLAVLAEAFRVLRPGGVVICSEVDNDTFRFSPDQPAIRQWWELFCHRQQEAGGDPFVGRRLDRLAELAGFTDISTRDLPVVSSHDQADRRDELLAYVRDLLMSGAGNLVAGGYVGAATTADLECDFARVAADRDIHFEYHATRMWCRRP